MTRLCTRISQRSQVLVPSPQGDLRTVRRSTLVGMRTGPRTLRPFSSRAPLIRSAQTCQHPHFSLSPPFNHFSLSLALALPRPLSPSSHFPLPSLLPHGRCASRALAQSARLPTGHPRLLVHCAVCCPSAAGTCMPTLRPYLLKALTFSRLATDLEVVRVMRILDSAPVASPSTCTPSRVSPAVAAICWWWARDEGPRTHRAEAWGGVALLVARVRPQHRWLSFRTHASGAHAGVGSGRVRPRNSPRPENAPHMHAVCAPHFGA